MFRVLLGACAAAAARSAPGGASEARAPPDVSALDVRGTLGALAAASAAAPRALAANGTQRELADACDVTSLSIGSISAGQFYYRGCTSYKATRSAVRKGGRAPRGRSRQVTPTPTPQPTAGGPFFYEQLRERLPRAGFSVCGHFGRAAGGV